jgi:hypothetical protein
VQVADKNKVTKIELVGMDCVGIFLLKLADGHEAGFDDVVLDGVKVFWSLLELEGLECYEFGGGHFGVMFHWSQKP